MGKKFAIAGWVVAMLVIAAPVISQERLTLWDFWVRIWQLEVENSEQQEQIDQNMSDIQTLNGNQLRMKLFDSTDNQVGDFVHQLGSPSFFGKWDIHMPDVMALTWIDIDSILVPVAVYQNFIGPFESWHGAKFTGTNCTGDSYTTITANNGDDPRDRRIFDVTEYFTSPSGGVYRISDEKLVPDFIQFQSIARLKYEPGSGSIGGVPFGPGWTYVCENYILNIPTADTSNLYWVGSDYLGDLPPFSPPFKVQYRQGE